jgi:hypothetical protein
MKNKFWHTILITFLTLLLFGAVVVAAKELAPQNDIGAQISPDDNAESHTIAARAAYTYTTVITVTSGTDPNDSKSQTCTANPPCTLRRAIVEARTASPSELPVLIRFDIPQNPAEGYDSGQQIWEIQVYNTTDLTAFRRLTSQIIIDGDTQPNGRATGPKIFIVGPGTGQKDGLVVGDIAGDDSIQIYGLGFQNFKTHMYVNTDDNIIEGNWFGLNGAGTAPYIRNDEPEDGSGNTGISFNGSPTNNVVRNNVFLGFDGVAAAIRGDDNLFEHNLIGTKADGSVDKQTSPSLTCTTVDWLGGGGISVADDGNRIENNTFAGLRQEVFQITTQPDAIRIDGDDHVIQNNKIGVDGTDTEVGVCGRAIYLAGANTPDHTQVLSNTIVNPEMSAVSINGLTTDANTLYNNTIKKTSGWPQVEGNPEPEDAIQFGPSVPDALRNFKPAAVTSIEGTAVSGTSGAGSSCPNCTVELFLDDTDAITEALQFLGRTVAGSNGNWSTTLPFELSAGQGIRTTSTTAQYNTIANMNAGTTTKLSELYTADFAVFLPAILR